MDIESLVERTSAPHTGVNNTVTKSDESATDGDRNNRMMRISNLVAVGQMELPVNAPIDDLRVIVHFVRQHRCHALVRHIARCIARELTNQVTKEISNE